MQLISLSKNKSLKNIDMKTLALIISMMTLLSVNSMGQSKKISKLLNKPETRNEIFKTILNNRELTADFMKAMKGNKKAMMTMKKNHQMMGQNGKMEMKNTHQMMDHGKMMGMMKDNPEMMQKMMSMMKANPGMMQKMMGMMMNMSKNDSVMRTKMATMMSKNPQMMQMCRQKMKEKGMMGKDGKMKRMNPENSKGNAKHNH